MVAKFIFGATTVLLAACFLYCRSSPLPAAILGEFFIENLSISNSSTYLRSKDIHNLDSSGNPSTAAFDEQKDTPPQLTERRRLQMEEGTEEDFFVVQSRNEHFPLFQPSKTYEVIGPTVFPKPTYMYEAEGEEDIKIEDEIVTYMQPTSGQHRPDQDSVFVYAAEYGFETYVLFFMTLYETGYKGDVVVGVSNLDWKKTGIREFLEYWNNQFGEDEMTVIVYVIPYHCYDLQGNVKDSSKGGRRVCQCHNMFGRKDQFKGGITPLLDRRHARTGQTIRYELYWIWSEHYDPDSWILLIDARDTVFQETPFARVPRRPAADVKREGGTLIFFGENADATSLGKSKYNRRWLTLAYGETVADDFYDKPTICSGSTMGEQSAIEAYLRAEVAESDESRTVIFGADQGFHNYLYYSNKLANAIAIARILVQDQGLGIVNNMGALRDKPLSEWGNGKIAEKTDSKYTIYNWDGTVAPVVHQYDRHKELSKWFHDVKYEEFKVQWEKMKTL